MAAKSIPLHAQDKLALLLSLVPYLIEHEHVAVTTAAAHFGVTPQQMRDMVRLIAVSGVPGETRQYLDNDLFDISWDELENNDRIVLTRLVAIDDSPRFSAREAAALIAGLQYLSSLPENADRDAVASLMAKLARSASGEPNRLAVAGETTDQTLIDIRTAVTAGTQLEFDYRNSRGDSERRRVDPLRIESVNEDWYLRGWCHLRRAVRTFRLDRIENLVTTDEPIVYKPNDIVLPETLFEPSPEDLTVDVDVSTAALALIADYIPEDAPRTIDGDVVHTHVRVAHYHGLKRLVGRFAGAVTVTAPDEARAIVAGWARDAAARYDQTP